MTAAEIYESVTNGGATDFAELVTVLNRNKPWCLIGGLAVNCYVEPVYTVDVDLVVVAANLEQIGRELEAAGFRLSSELNVQFTTDARYQDFLAGATECQVLGLAVPVASLQEIVRGKVWAWQDKERRSTKRKKDKLGLMRIAEAHPKLRGLIPAEIVKQL
ncbi:MAG: hypothetical protein DME51_05810 [Verrucomicrobia bacterium]|nr:MAG: hypothetical protein DME51_05810 [Verrucomicrobiota bacterium]